MRKVKGKRSLKSPRTSHLPFGSTNPTAAPASPAQPPKSPMPSTEDRPPRGSVGAGLDELVFEKHPLPAVDSLASGKATTHDAGGGLSYSEVVKNRGDGGSSNNANVEPFPDQFEGSESPMIYSASGGISTADGRHLPRAEAVHGSTKKNLEGKEKVTDISPETEELAHDQLQPGDFGVNIGGDGHVHHDGKWKGKGKQPAQKVLSDTEPQSPVMVSGISDGPEAHASSNDEKGKGEEKQPLDAEDGGSQIPSELQSVFLEKDYGTGNEGEPGEKREKPEPSRTRKRLSHSEPPDHSTHKEPTLKGQTSSPQISPETNELQHVSIGKGEIGHNIGNGPPSGHSKRKHPDTSLETEELRPNHLHREDIGPQHTKATAETRELRHMGLGKDEIGYNPGKGDQRDRREPGEHPQVKKQASWSSGTDGGAEELGYINVDRGDFGYNVGKGNEPGEEAGENPEASRVRARFGIEQPHHSIKSTQSLETQQPGSTHLKQRDTDPQQTQASPETRELRNVELRGGEFGYNVGRGEESGRIRPDEDSTENPSAARARRRASAQSNEEKPAFGPYKPRRTSQDLGIEPEMQSCTPPNITTTFNAAPGMDKHVNETLQSYLQVFLSERGSDPTGTISECPKIRSSRALEGATEKPMSSRDHTVLRCEHRQKKKQVEPPLPPPPAQAGAGGAAVTLDQLQAVLERFKSDILSSIDASPGPRAGGGLAQLAPRLGRIESEVGFIRKQVCAPTTTLVNGLHVHEVAAAAAVVGGGGGGRGGKRSVYSRDSAVRWGVIGLGVVAALGLVALGGVLGSIRHAERGLADRMAGWLFREGRGQKI